VVEFIWQKLTIQRRQNNHS